MSLRDIMSHADLALFPEVGMILFLAAFAAVVYQVLKGDPRWDRAAHLPLEGEEPS